MSSALGRVSLVAAVALATLLAGLAPASPPSQAAHDRELRVGDVRPGDCLVVEADPDALLSNVPEPPQPPASADEVVEEARQPDPVPIVCQEPMNDTMRELIRRGNRLVRGTETVADRLGQQTHRVEGAAEIPFLLENFTAERIGGLGNWTGIEAGGPGFVRAQHPTTGDGFSLVRSPGQRYPAGMDAALVSPAIDLGGTLLRPSVATLPDRIQAVGERQLREEPPGSPASEGSTIDVCLRGATTTCVVEDAQQAGGAQAYRALREAYLDTTENLTRSLAEASPEVELEIRHRFNLARGLDGVRYEVITEPPQATPGIPEGTPIEPVDADGDRFQDTAAGGGRPAFTGNTSDWVTHRFDLTQWADERIWLVARAQTVPSFFEATVRQRLGPGPFQGYAIDGAFVNATVAPRNLRVLDVDAGQVRVDGNWTVPPPLGDRDARVAVTNQGIDATAADVRLEACTHRHCRTEATWNDVHLPAGDVRVLEANLLSVGTDRATLRATIEDTDEADRRADADPDDNTLEQPLTLEAVERVRVHPAPDTRRGLAVDPLEGGDDPREVRLEVSNAGNVPVTRDVELAATLDGRPVPSAVQDPRRSFDLEPEASTTLSWTLTPPGDGVYRLEVRGLGDPDTLAGAAPTGLAYVERSPGVVCADDTHRGRACGQAWQVEAQLPRQDDERLDADRVRSAALTPDGVPAVLTDEGRVLAAGDGEWTEWARHDPLQWLVTDGDRTLGLTDDGSAHALDAAGLGPRTPTGLEEVQAVAVTQTRGVVVAGEAPEAPIGVASWDGSRWSVDGLAHHPDAVVRDVTVARDGTPIVTALAPNGTLPGTDRDRYDVLVCTFVGERLPALQCPEVDEPTDRARLPGAAEVDRREPAVEVGTHAGSIFLAVEGPVVRNRTSDCADVDPAPGRACLLQLPGALGDRLPERPTERRPLPPGTTEDDAFPVALETVGSETWLRDALAEGSRRLQRPAVDHGGDPLRIAGLPVSGSVAPLGGGPETAAAVVGTHVLAADATGPTPQEGNGWEPRSRLLPQTADRVITTVEPAGVGEGPEAARHSGPDETAFLRASCVDAGLDAVVRRALGLQSAEERSSPDEAADNACLEIDLFPLSVDLGSRDAADLARRNVEDQQNDDELGLDVRYNLRELGRTRPEIRLVLQPAQKLQLDALTGLRSAPSSDPEGEIASTEGLADLYPTIERQANLLLGCLAGGGTTIAACDVSGFTGERVRGEIDEEDRVEVPSESTRSPHVVTVHDLETTGRGWETARVDLDEELRELGLDRESWRLLGLEFAFPQDTQAALDAVWMNRTNPGEREVLLFTDGREANGTWKRSLLPDRAGSSSFLTPVATYALNEGVRIGTQCRLNDVREGSDCEPRSPPSETGSERSDVRDRTSGLPAVQPTPYDSTFDSDGDARNLTPVDATEGQPTWHLSNVTNRPSWTFMGPRPSSQMTVDEPVRDRLATPVVDLRDAERPTLSFEHAYAFNWDDAGPTFEGLGWVEAQVETEPGEWSPWFRLRPEDGYPDRVEDGPEAYYGASLPRDRNDTHRPLLDVDRWEEATFDLVDQPRPLPGHRVRFAFHAVFENLFDDDDRDFEGWAVSGLRVESTTPLNDLALEEARVQEAFDARETGLPPGTSVDVNVTIENEGDRESGPRRLAWELVGVGTLQEVVDQGVRPLPSLTADQRTSIQLSLPVPHAGELERLGIDEGRGGVYLRLGLEGTAGTDEDPTNDRLRLGSPTDPFPVRETRGLEVRLEALPEDGPVDRTRTVKTILNNTGNVPLQGLRVDRTVQILRGSQGTQPARDGFEPATTTRALPAGEEDPLSSLAAAVGIEDVLWEPPRVGSFLVQASVRGDGTAGAAQASLAASEAALFSSVEAPVEGEPANGTFEPGPGWASAGPGAFGSAEAFHLRPDDVRIGPEGRNLSLDFPSVDLTNFRRADLSLVHRFAFEPAFDGGTLQASTDGGETWHTLVPEGHQAPDADDASLDTTPSDDVLGAVLGGGNPMAAGELVLPAFTGNTTGKGTGGWVSSSFDLSRLDALREPGEVARHRFEDLRENTSREVAAPPAEAGPDTVYTHPSWTAPSRPIEEGVYVENRTPRLEEDTLLYTGSVRDQREAGPERAEGTPADPDRTDSGNFLARFDVDLPEIEDPDAEVHILWEEWGPIGGRQDVGTEILTGSDATPLARGLWSDASPKPGCTDPTISPSLVSVDGATRQFLADVTPLAHADDVSTVHLAFMAHGWFENDRGDWTWGLRDEHVTGLSGDHPGHGIADLRVKTFRRSPAGPVAVETEPVSPSEARRQELPRRDLSFDPSENSCPPSSGGGGAGSSGVFRTVEETASVNTTWHAVELGEDTENETTVLSASEPREHLDGRVWDPPENGDSRLVLPPLDLVSGDNVTLTFDHVPAFGMQNRRECDDHQVGGGVVEVSVFDPARNRWGDWNQIYPEPDEMGQHAAGGYDGGDPVTAYEVKPLDDQDEPGCVTTFPFELHDGIARDGETPVKRPYLYNTCIGERNGTNSEDFDACSGIADLTGGQSYEDANVVQDWRPASFDLSNFTGRRIRLAFHASFLPDCDYETVFEPGSDFSGDSASGRPGAQPRDDHSGCPVDGSRWLLDNVTVEGQAFAGQPVDLRFQAGLDGSIHNASWSADEIGLVGERYDRNVGVYLDETPDEIAPGGTVSIDGELRNMGSQLRRDLVVRARLENAPGDVSVQLADTAPVEAGEEARSEAVALDAGESTPLHLEVRAADSLTRDRDPLIRVEVLRLSDLLGTPTRLEGEDVTSNLERVVDLDPQPGGLSLGDPELDRTRVPAGETTTVRLPVRNPGSERVRLDVECTVGRVQTWLPVDHGTGGEHTRPVTTGEGECAPLDAGRLALEDATGETPFEVTLPREGVYEIRFEARDLERDRDLRDRTAKVSAGDAARVFFADFEDDEGRFTSWESRSRGTGDNNYQGGGAVAVRTEEAAWRGNWSTRMGLSREAYESGRTYFTGQASRILTPPVDTHNLTGRNATLTFYHMARFAFGDGADVRVRVMANEPARTGTDWCKLYPEDGYAGFVASYRAQPTRAQAPSVDPGNPRQVGTGSVDRQETDNDLNPAHENSTLGFDRRHGFYGSHETEDGDAVPRWDETWKLASFPLHEDPRTGEELRCGGEPLTGRTIQFAFTLYAGEADDAPPQQPGADPDPLDRGRGQAWYLDSAVVSTGQVNQTPRSLTAPLVDEAPKRLPIRLANEGSLTEYPTLRLDPDETTVQPSRTQAGDRLVVPGENETFGELDVQMPRKRLSLAFQHRATVRGTDLLDPNLPATTTFDLPFEPRTWGDLTVSFREPENAVVEGVPALIPVEVTNDGLDRSPPTDLVVQDRFGSTTRNLTASLPALPPAAEEPDEATTVVFVPFTPARGTAGTHHLTAHADPDGELEEYTRADNVVERELTVHPLRIPDLVLEEDNLTVESVSGEIDRSSEGTLETYTAPSETLVRVTVPVSNVGNEAATRVDVRLFYGSLALPAERIERLAPGQSEEVSFTFVVADGVRDLSLETSSGDRDLDPEDNAAPTQGRLRLRGLQFAVDASTAEPVRVPEPGSTVDTTIELANDAGVGVLVELDPQAPSGIRLRPAVEQVFLEPGGNATVNASVHVAPDARGGPHTVHLGIRQSSNASRSTEAPIPIHVRPRHALSLSTGTAALDPGPNRVPVTLDNGGNVPEQVGLQARLDGEPVSPEVDLSAPRGVPRTVELPLRLPPAVEPGPHRLSIVANGTTRAEHVRTVEVAGTALLETETAPARASLGPDGLELPLRVANLGNRPFSGRLSPVPGQAPADARIQPPSLELGPGEGANASLVAVAADRPRPAALQVEGSGVSHRLDVDLPAPQTDLAVLRQEARPERPDPGEETRLRVTVANAGNATARRVPVDLFLDEEFAARVTVDALAPDASRTLTFEWPAFEGEHVVTSLVDPDDRFPDPRPDNDRANLRIRAGEGGLLSGLAGGPLGVPGPGALAAPMLGLAALLWRSRRPPGRGGDA